MMHPRKIPSILVAAILAGVFIFSSSTLLTPMLAQSGTEQGGESSQEESDTGGDIGADTGADTGAARQDYQEFNTCLTEAEGGEGFATEDEIRECFQPIYIGVQRQTNLPKYKQTKHKKVKKQNDNPKSRVI
jgi:hypothetical protein